MRLQPLLPGRSALGQYPRQSRDEPANDLPRPYGSSRKAAATALRPAPKRAGSRSGRRRHTRTALKTPRARASVRAWLLWLAVSMVGASAIAVGALIALAPTLTDRGETWHSQQHRSPQHSQGAEPLRVALDGEHFYQLDMDPRQVEFGLLRGWDREQEAFADPDALAFISGPMYERYYWPDPRLEQAMGQTVQPSSPQRAADQGYTVPLGDLKFGSEIWRGLNRAAAGQRAFIAIDHAGEATFGYGELTAARAHAYETFIGGLHVLYNDLQPVQPGYQGAYSKGMGQKIRYYLPRVRVVIGLRPDRRLEVLMSKDGLTLEETRALSRKRGLVAAYLPDHASKSRFIVPDVKGFSEEDANWISGGSVSYVHVPYMIRIGRRRQPADVKPAAPLAALPQAPEDPGCSGPLSCAREGMLWAGDRSLSGLNRLVGAALGGRSLPEPSMTADPPASQLQFPPTTPTAALPRPHDPGTGIRPWESAWMPNPTRQPEGASPAATRDDMAAPVVVPQDADEDFWEQIFPPLPALADLDQGTRPATAPARSRTAPHQQPPPPLLSTHNSRPPSPLDEPPPALLPARPVAQGKVIAEQQPPPPPALGLGLDSLHDLPRLDPQNL